MVANSGDGLVRPINAPGSAPPAYGTQPGTTPAVIRAALVLVGGTGTSGVFVYDPSIGAGNLIASMTDAAADPFGNVTAKGVSAYVVDVNSLREAVNLNESSVSGNAGLGINDTAHPAAAAPGAYGQGSGTGGLSRATAYIDSGLVTNADVDAVVSVQSQTHSGITNGLAQALAGEVDLGATPTLIVSDNAGTATMHQALLSVPAAPGNGFSLYAGATSAPQAITTSGFNGGLAMVKTDISTHTAGNDASVHDITAARICPAGEATTGTAWTIKALIRVNTGQTTIETLTIGVDIDGGGQVIPLATLGTAFNGGALNTVYSVPVELTLTVNENGASTPGIYLLGSLGDESANRLATNSANMSGHSDTATWDPSVQHTLAIYAQWGGAGGSAQNAHTTSSRLYREGP